MFSFELRHARALAAGILMLAAAVAPGLGFSQTSRQADAAAEQQRLLIEQIDQEQSLNGPHSAGLIGPLAALGLQFDESGDRRLAAAAIERTLQVVRANYGIHALEQAPLLRQLIANREAVGELETAWELEHELVALAARHPDDLRTVPIYRELAEKRLDLLERYRAGEIPPQIILGCYYNRSTHYGNRGRSSYTGFDDDRYVRRGSCASGEKHAALAAIQTEIGKYYAVAIDALLQHELYASDELRELEIDAVRTLYLLVGPDMRYRCPTGQLGQLLELDLLRSCLAPLPDKRSWNVGGTTSLIRLVAYEVRSSAPPLMKIAASTQLTDWNLLFADSLQDSEATFQAYQQAYRELEQNGVERAAIDELFAPPAPIVLPAFLPNPLVSKETPESTGYIDVAFAVTKYGVGQQIEILDTTTNATRADKKALIALIRRSHFRPRATDGQIADVAPVVVRYYLNARPDAFRRGLDERDSRSGTATTWRSSAAMRPRSAL